MRRVSQIFQTGFDARKIGGANQQINVAGLPQRDVAVERFR